ncbi:Asp23/Gls24 family envelope stress response protein [Micromonospora sp. D93]|uniref:Asp23/Gls24 family envelope stress response protein n=1 Tax=Micromonospora sp. D93 TaxID=2824886 RepID=UPI001B387265|nr:Asp23/Gls24 family envelope stress response protein [Micromonospora sp. D93]MBQ1020335.1 Asp23/Gls24 family envelope stress response protein [Micromonospora sp. D93]
MDLEATHELTRASVPAGGTTEVADEVIEKIVVAAARAVPGVADLGGDVARFFNAVLDRVGLDQVGDARRGCSAHVTGDAAVVNLVLVIEAGRPVPEITGQVRAQVTEAVEAYGLRVDEVNIRVDDVAMGGPAAAVTSR